MDARAALLLQIEWGADEAIGDVPVDRFAARAPARHAPVPTPGAASAGPRPNPGPEPVPMSGAVARAEAEARRATDLDSLQAALAAFDGCALRDTAGTLVFADGDPASPLLVVTEAPDEADDESGRPLSGATGALLDRVLGHAGFSRGDCRVACLVPWRPPGGRPANPAEIAACRPFLASHLRLLGDAPRLALLLGATVARALATPDGTVRSGPTGTTRQLRGTWLELRVEGRALPLPGLVMIPPNQILTDAKSKQATWSDMLMLRRAFDGFSSSATAK